MELKSLHPVLKTLSDIAGDLARAIGPDTEVVIHDLSRPTSSIIAIGGDVTGRKVGGPITDLVLRLLRSGETDRNLINYETQTADGRVLRSSTIFLRDEYGRVIGCLCINQDISGWLWAERLVSGLCETSDPLAPGEKTEETFAVDVPGLLRTSIRKAVQAIGTPVSLMDKKDRVAIVKTLDAQGIFTIRGSVGYTAEELRVSRYSIYNYLEEAKEVTPENNR